MINKVKNLITKYRELITYVIAGGLTTLVNWVVYTLLVHFAKTGIGVSNAVAWVVSVIFAYVINKLWVFESKSTAPKIIFKEFFSFVGSRALTGAMEIFGVPFLVSIGLNQRIFNIEGALSKVIVSVVVIILNYVFSKLIVFKKEKPKD
ncbi:MAG: GtrA family protein [Eubacterium sp.]